MSNEEIFQLIKHNFKLSPTGGQETAMHHLAAFLSSAKQSPLYLLKGYAGTGKTTIVATLVRILPVIGMQCVLLAPTGRAAKVLQNYSGIQAFTIHRKIYYHRITADGTVKLLVIPNQHKNTLFIVDEASMIGDSSRESAFFRSNNLLDDLMQYVQEGEHCRLMLIGDHAQLPPVGSDLSPALDLQYLKTTYAVTAAAFELTEVMRQSLESGILYNATRLRDKLINEDFELPLFKLKGFTDIIKLSGEEFEDLMYDAFGEKDYGKAVIICRSNRMANNYNNAIRSRILGYDGQITGGDLLMVVKNNYFWAAESMAQGQSEHALSFIANGDMVVVNRISRIEEYYGFRFADADISFIDYPDQPAMQVKLLLDTLMAEGPSLNEEDYRKLAAAIEEEYSDIPNRNTRIRKIRNNPFYNALQVKYGYAITCHKTQGGQWEQVVVDGAGLKTETIDVAYLRWLYTAITRATNKLMLVNFSDEVYSSSMN